MARKKLKWPLDIFWAGYKLRILEEKITTEQAADVLGVSVRRVQQYLSDHRIPYEKIGKNNFIKLGDALNFKESADLRPGKRSRWAEK